MARTFRIAGWMKGNTSLPHPHWLLSFVPRGRWQCLGCAGVGMSELVSITPWVCVLWASAQYFVRKGVSPLSLLWLERYRRRIQTPTWLQVKQAVTMGKLREVGGFKGQSTKQRHSLVMKVLPSLRFRVHDSGQVFKLSKHWETTKSGYPIVSDSNKNCSPVSGSCFPLHVTKYFVLL